MNGLDVLIEGIVRFFMSILHFILMFLFDSDLDFYKLRWIVVMLIN